MTRVVAVGLLVCCCLALALPAVGGSASAGGDALAQADGSSGGPGGGAFAQASRFDRTVFRYTVFANGTARWTIEHQQILQNESEVEDFRAYADRFRNNETGLYEGFVTGARALVETRSNATGREMTASHFQRSARVSVDTALNDRGIVTMSFHWSNFGTVEGDRVHVGDVFGGGPYVDAGQRLSIVAGPDLAFASVEPEDYERSGGSLARSDRVWWTGVTDFGPNRPRVTFQPASATGTTATPTGPGGGGIGGLALAVALFVVAVGLGGAAVWRTRGRGPIADAVRGVLAGVGATAEGDETEQAGVSDEELLSDEDRVVRLLQGNGGRMKQVEIVEETEWSKSKVSMLLSDMEDDGEISKLRVGRENIISLAGHEPDAAGSPFEDE